jgi:glutathionylspermidine amidase/synthetase
MTGDKNGIAPFDVVQGIASTNVPAYSNEHDDFVSFEGFYIHGIFTGFKWQCVEFARRWLLLRKSCIFQNVMSAADMWRKLTYIERVTDGQKFRLKPI